MRPSLYMKFLNVQKHYNLAPNRVKLTAMIFLRDQHIFLEDSLIFKKINTSQISKSRNTQVHDFESLQKNLKRILAMHNDTNIET